MTIDPQCKLSLLLYSQLDAQARVNSFARHINDCPCWFCRLDILRLSVPIETKTFLAYWNYMHFCLYPRPNSDLN